MFADQRLFDAAKSGVNDAVVAALSEGSDVNWANSSEVCEERLS